MLKFQCNPMKTVGGYPEKKCRRKKSLKRVIASSKFGERNFKTICAVSPHGLTVHQVSTLSDENCRRLSRNEVRTDEQTPEGIS